MTKNFIKNIIFQSLKKFFESTFHIHFQTCGLYKNCEFFCIILFFHLYKCIYLQDLLSINRNFVQFLSSVHKISQIVFLKEFSHHHYHNQLIYQQLGYEAFNNLNEMSLPLQEWHQQFASFSIHNELINYLNCHFHQIQPFVLTFQRMKDFLFTYFILEYYLNVYRELIFTYYYVSHQQAVGFESFEDIYLNNLLIQQFLIVKTILYFSDFAF